MNDLMDKYPSVWLCVSWKTVKKSQKQSRRLRDTKSVLYECALLCVGDRGEKRRSALQIIQIREFDWGCLNYNSCWLIYKHHVRAPVLQLASGTWSKAALSRGDSSVRHSNFYQKINDILTDYYRRPLLGNDIFCVTGNIFQILACF